MTHKLCIVNAKIHSKIQENPSAIFMHCLPAFIVLPFFPVENLYETLSSSGHQSNHCMLTSLKQRWRYPKCTRVTVRLWSKTRPNNVIINDENCGILAEAELQIYSCLPYSVIGIGIHLCESFRGALPGFWRGSLLENTCAPMQIW